MTDGPARGRAWILKGADSDNTWLPRVNDDEKIEWTKFFEDYRSVTALALARSNEYDTDDTTATSGLWGAHADCSTLPGSPANCWQREPAKEVIGREFVAAFL